MFEAPSSTEISIMKSSSMTRTLIFAAVAIISTVLAIAANHLTKPGKAPEYEGFGQDFNPDFTDASRATSMRVVSFDEATASAKMFTVEYQDGWKIPSYHNYPADGKDQLAKAAASVIGLKRGALATRRKTDHERFGVIDPLDEDNPSTKGRGTRITISQKDVPLADFIVGHKVEGSDDKRYVRKFGEDKVYVVSAKFDVSTKFADWAETDLLKVSGWDIIRLRGSRPKINDQDEYEGDDVVELTRDKSGDPWKLVGLDEATEELKTDDINTMVNTLDDLRLVGVRPRPSFEGKPILNADLKVELPKQLLDNPEVRTQVVQMLRADLGEKGFLVSKDEAGETQLVSREGELVAGTKDGVVYKLTFGSVFTGTEQEIEIGSSSESKDKDKEDAKKDGSKTKPDELKKSRYLIVRVNFDEKLLGEPPVEPTKPTPPPGVEPPADDQQDSDKKDATSKSESDKTDADKKTDTDAGKSQDSQKPASDSTEKKSSDAATGANGDDAVAPSKDSDKDKPAKTDDRSDADKKSDTAADKNAAEKTDEKKTDKKDDAPADKPPPQDSSKAEAKKDELKSDEPKKDLKAEYQEALKRYDAEKGRYAADKAAFEAKIESGKQKVKELNDRFADWYYVISNDSFDKLRLSRADLVKKKEKPAEKADAEKKDGEKEKKDGNEKDADPPAEKSDSDKNESNKSAEKTDAEKKAADKSAEKNNDKKDSDEKQEEKSEKKDKKSAEDQ